MAINEENGGLETKNLMFSIDADLLEKFNPDGIGPDQKNVFRFIREYIKRCNEYKNAARELERIRRNGFREYIRSRNPEIIKLSAACDLACGLVDEIIDEIKEEMIKSRSRLCSDELSLKLSKAKSEREKAFRELNEFERPYQNQVSVFQKECKIASYPQNGPKEGPRVIERYKKAALDMQRRSGVSFEAECEDSKKELKNIFCDLGSGTRWMLDRTLSGIKGGGSHQRILHSMEKDLLEFRSQEAQRAVCRFAQFAAVNQQIFRLGSL